MKPYQTIPIRECGEPLVDIPEDAFHRLDPHPYIAAGASYDGVSPWRLRASVLQALLRAQDRLAQIRPGHRLSLFDCYRPRPVQTYMVEREIGLVARAAGLDPANLTNEQRAQMAEKAYRVWARPSDDPLTPPPHSTGGAVDLTIVDAGGHEINMGSPIDENSDRSNPDYFAAAQDETGRAAHANRTLLRDVMCAEGFRRHKIEWWHFSIGDQYWAWRERDTNPAGKAEAVYGRADLL